MVVRLRSVLGLVAAEYVGLVFAFDADRLEARSDTWRIASKLGTLAILMFAALAGVVLMALFRGQARLSYLGTGRAWNTGTAARLVAHVFCFAALTYLSARIFAPAGPPPGEPLAWLCLWIFLALTTPLLAIAAALPDTEPRRLFAHGWPDLIGGTCIGLGAYVAGIGSKELWLPFGPLTLHGAAALLSLFADEVVFLPDEFVVGTPSFEVYIAPHCSGFEGVGLMMVFASTYLLLARGRLRFPHALLLLPIGIGVAWLANLLRLALLVFVGSRLSPELATTGFHAKAGWVFFAAIALSLVMLAERTRLFAQSPSSPDISNGEPQPTAAFLLPFLVLVATALLTGLVHRQVELFYAARLLTVLPVLLHFRRYLGARLSDPDRAGRGSPWRKLLPVVAGLVAALGFLWLLPAPSPERMALFSSEWSTLPDWTQMAWLITRAAGSIFIVPVAEELAFRGYLLRRLVAREFELVPYARLSAPALVLSSIAFGAVHDGWLAGTFAGLVFGLCQFMCQSLGAAIIAHMVSNLALAIFVFGWDALWLWS